MDDVLDPAIGDEADLQQSTRLVGSDEHRDLAKVLDSERIPIRMKDSVI